jgi:hypothetical protein
VRRLPEGDEHDRVEAELRVRLLRQYEMTDVRRVEGTAEDSEPRARYDRLTYVISMKDRLQSRCQSRTK